MGKIVFTGILILLCIVFFLADSLAQHKTPASFRGDFPIDKGIMFGHQDDLAYGYHWKYEIRASLQRRILKSSMQLIKYCFRKM